MKKSIFLGFTLLVSTMSVQAQGPSQEDIHASEMIELTNAVIDMSNDYNQKFRHYSTVLKQADRNYERFSKKYDQSTPVNYSANSYPIADRFKTAYQKALEGFSGSEADKEEIHTAVEAANAYTASLEEWALRMRDYFKNREFENDKLAGYKTARDSVVYYSETSQEAWSKASKIASEMGDKAETHLMAGDPIADFIIPMKGDLRDARGLVDVFYAMIEEEDYEFTSLKKELSDFQSRVELHKSTEDKDVSVLKSEFYFTNYYKAVDDTIENLSLLMEELNKTKPERYKIERYNGALNTCMKRLVNGYNQFIQSGTR